MGAFISTIGERSRDAASILVASESDPGKDLAVKLREAGHRTRCAPAARLTRMIEAELPDLVIADGPDALDLCRTLKAAPPPGIPIILVTDARLDAITAGADHVLATVDLPEIQARIPHLLRAVARDRAMSSKIDTVRLWHDWVRYLVHDLRNPVTIATTYVGMARHHGDNADSAARHLQEAEHALDEVRRMLQDILDTDRIKHGVLELVKEEIDLAVLAEKSAERARLQHPVDIATEGDTAIVADRVLIGRVLDNLVTNALRHAANKPIEIAISGSAHGISVRVTNDGVGIDPALQPHLFDPWHKFEGKRNATGLGLAFCRLVCESHGGRIWLDAGETGAVTFAFGIPRTPLDPKTAAGELLASERLTR